MKSLWIKGVAALAVGLLMMGGGAASANGALPRPTVAPAKASPGETISISGEDCFGDPGEVIVKVAAWAPLTATADGSGKWTVKVPVPADAAPGELKVAATCDAYNLKTEYPTASFTVVVKDAPDPGKATVTTDVGTVAAGGSVTVTASGFEAGEKVSVTLFSDPVKLGELTVDAKGAASDTFTIPVSVAAGVHRLELRGLTSERVASAEITVTGPSAAPPTNGVPPGDSTQGGSPGASAGNNLALTGSSALQLGLVGFMVVLVGAGVLALRRRRIA
jgi:LPXTG-motif cell wall-anchored protein